MQVFCMFSLLSWGNSPLFKVFWNFIIYWWGTWCFLFNLLLWWIKLLIFQMLSQPGKLRINSSWLWHKIIFAYYWIYILNNNSYFCKARMGQTLFEVLLHVFISFDSHNYSMRKVQSSPFYIQGIGGTERSNTQDYQANIWTSYKSTVFVKKVLDNRLGLY